MIKHRVSCKKVWLPDRQTNEVIPMQWLGRGFCLMGHFQLFSMILKFSMGHFLSFYTNFYGPFSKLMGLWRMAPCFPNHCLCATMLCSLVCVFYIQYFAGFSLGFWKGESRDSPLLKMVSPTKFWWVPVSPVLHDESWLFMHSPFTQSPVMQRLINSLYCSCNLKIYK